MSAVKLRALAHYSREAEEAVICGGCSGSGEGMHEGANCGTCGGSGEVLDGAEFDDDGACDMRAEWAADAADERGAQ